RAKQFQSQAKMLKDDVRAERMKALAQEEQQLQGLLMQYQTDINKKKGEALGQFEVKLRAIIETVAQKEGLDYILRHEVLLFGPPKMDMTNDVIREYDKKFPKKAAAPAK
ncbi:MAG TPA: OmpH family outer membrane protein, partial [Myxococcota bacterium]|nr:OmpH family outer membrane protein [Myxococcota bacterium]